MKRNIENSVKPPASGFNDIHDGAVTPDIFDSLPFGVIATDKDGIIIKANAKAEEIIRVRAEHLIGTALSDWNTQTDNLSLLTGDNASCFREKGGRKFIVSKSPLSRFRKNAGAVYSILDITAFDGSGLLPSEFQCNLESLIENSHDGIILIDHEKIVRVNSSYLRISGLKKNKIEGMKISSLSDSLHV